MKIILKKELRIWGDPNTYSPNGKIPTIETLKSAFKKNPENIKASVENWDNLLIAKKKKTKEEIKD